MFSSYYSYSSTIMNKHNNNPSYHLHSSDQHSNACPPETRETDLSPHKNWGIIHNNSSSNRRKKSATLHQKTQEIQAKEQWNLKQSLRRGLQKSNSLLNQMLSDQPFPLPQNSQNSNLNQPGSVPDNDQLAPQQGFTASRKQGWFAEGDEMVSSSENEEMQGGKSYLTKIIYGEHTKKQKNSNMQLFSSPIKPHQQFVLGLESGKSAKEELSNKQPKDEQIADLSLESKKSVDNILTNLMPEKMMKKPNRCNDSVNTFSTSLKLQVVVDCQLAACENCGYETEKDEQIRSLCRFCYLLDKREKNISFGDSLQKQRRDQEIEKRVRARTLSKNPRGQRQGFKRETILGKRVRMASTQKVQIHQMNAPGAKNYEKMNKSREKVKCMNPGCREKGGTLIRFEGLNFCLKCYYEMKTKPL